jgi:hypothetical protein
VKIFNPKTETTADLPILVPIAEMDYADVIIFLIGRMILLL